MLPEQCHTQVRHPAQLCAASIPESGVPPTVLALPADGGHRLSLEEAIAIAVQNSQVVRILGGEAAISSGRTIYDPAIANAAIDEQRSVFDPRVQVTNDFNRVELPNGQLANVGIQNFGFRSDGYALSADVSKRTASGGTATFRVGSDRLRFNPAVFPLNPLTTTATEFSYVQPLLRGSGWDANRVPIVVARIETEQSFFQLKGALQRMVADLVRVYWSLVVARLNRDVRQQQVEYAQQVYDQAKARLAAEESDGRDVTQSATTLALLEAELVAADADVLQQEAALRNMMGLPPAGAFATLVPITAPISTQLDFDWDEALILAEQFRPDVVELKLVLEADQQLRIQANNEALPQLDAVALYRWNGLEGTTLGGSPFRTDAEHFQDWTLGVNFSVPIGLRRERAALRRQELLISRDRENIDQALHAASHLLAQSLRKQAQAFKQYSRFRTARLAAEENLGFLQARFHSDLGARSDILLRVLQTIQDWGTSVQGEATSLGTYNSELSQLELETGTILESHAIRLVEEQRAFIGPFGRRHAKRCFVSRLPAVSSQQIEVLEDATPSEEFFQLEPIFRIDRAHLQPESNEVAAGSDPPLPKTSSRRTSHSPVRLPATRAEHELR